MKHEFSNFQEWKTAAAAIGLVVERSQPSHEGMHESDMYEPSFVGKYLPRTVECPEEAAFQAHGIFSTDWDEDGKNSVCSGIFFDTAEEFEAECEQEMFEEHKEIEAAADRFNATGETPVLDQIVRDCMGPTNELNAQPQDWPTAWRNGHDPD